MGRRPKAAEDKRQLIGARFDPVDKDRVEQFAVTSGRSAALEVERRVRATLDYDEQGLELIEQIGREIAAIQKGFKGRRWHKDLVVWSAVTHMLRTGPIMLARPESATDDEDVNAAYTRWEAAKKERKELVDRMANLGFAWLEAPVSRNALTNPFKGGLFGQIPPVDARKRESDEIDNVEDEGIRNTLREIHDSLLDLDRKVEQFYDEWLQLMLPYEVAEKEGRDWNRERQMERARQIRLEGGQPDFYQLTGIDPWNLKGS